MVHYDHGRPEPALSLTDLIIRAFRLIDDVLAEPADERGPLGQRGPRPTLADSEVLTVEIVGVLLGIDTEAGLSRHFRRYYADPFPALARVHPTSRRGWR